MSQRFPILRYSAVCVLAAGVAFAQTGKAPQHPPSHAAAHAAHPSSAAEHHLVKFQDVATLLNLTSTQQTQAKQIFQNAWNSSRPLMPQFEQNREAIKSLLKSGNVSQFNTQIEPLAKKEGTLVSDMIMIRTKAMEQFYAILTPDQRTKAASLYDLMTTHFPFRLQVAPTHPGTATPSD